MILPFSCLILPNRREKGRGLLLKAPEENNGDQSRIGQDPERIVAVLLEHIPYDGDKGIVISHGQRAIQQKRRSDMGISRRNFLRAGAVMAGTLAAGIGLPRRGSAAQSRAVVYATKSLDSESLRKMYALVRGSITGRVAVKLHTGEPGGPNILPRDWVRDLQAEIPQSSIVECNVLYPSPRQTTEGHRKVIEQNGWTFCPVDIMDAEGDAVLPVRGGRHLKELAVGAHLLNYDSMLVLTHFKGHTLGGFGGSLKNISIGCASGATGKQQLHQVTAEGGWPGGAPFMERMVEGGKAVVDHFNGHIAYINVLRNMSVSCDCEGTAAEPVRLPDLGMLASTDLQAVDRASVDMIYALPADVRAPMVDRMESREGLRQLSYMKEMGMGSSDYELVWV